MASGHNVRPRPRGSRRNAAGPEIESAFRAYFQGMPAPRICIIILAAGRSTRFGDGDKLTAPLAGTPVIRHVAAASLAAGSGDVVVVTGRSEVRAALDGLPVHCTPGRGDAMGSSIAAGVAAAPNADGWMIWPGDMPLVRADTARRIALAFDHSAPTVPVHDGRRGHPVLFPSRFRGALGALTEDMGARAVLAAAGRVVEVSVEDPGICFDIDSPEDLAAAGKLIQ